MASYIDNGKRFRLTDPLLAPNGAGFLWNRHMMIQMNCKGYAVSQYMDPEPRKYAHVPNVAAHTFMQPEQGYYAHHPGRFFYVRDNDSGALFSAPYAPVCTKLDRFEFEQGVSDISWLIEQDGIRLCISLSLPEDDVLELWSVKLTNLSGRERSISFLPYFPVGYASWMNQGGHFDADLNAAVASCITPYQKVEQYFQNQHLKDLTFLASSRKPDAFEMGQAAFEGEGGLHNPQAIQNGGNLLDGEAHYETPACIMQWNLSMSAGCEEDFEFIFGPASDKEEIQKLKQAYQSDGQSNARQQYDGYVQSSLGGLKINSPDEDFNHFVNVWLPRQVFYHGDVHRLTTDPQTRNYLQDAIGMAYINPEKSREAILRSLSQQYVSGKVPDGILLRDDAELKYINQVPHTDHAIWLVLTLDTYLSETGDQAILQEKITWNDSDELNTVLEHVSRAMDFLCSNVDQRGLPFIEQGDWCDPMNMVGYKGKGVSGWLAQAMSYAMGLWSEICDSEGHTDAARDYCARTLAMNKIINQHLWDGSWYGRGITDDGVMFGISDDKEGRIFLNSQSWALLSGAADDDKKDIMLSAIDEQLETPYGAMMCAPAFTKMREDVGRVTQKWPGSAENGSVYNHAAIFYAAALFCRDEADRAYSLMKRMLTTPNEKDIARRGQLPIFIPNYYRGAYYQFPRTAGRSSNLFNTGTVAWYYRLVQEQICGLRGQGRGVVIDPQIPSDWQNCDFVRSIRGATFEISYSRKEGQTGRTIVVDGVKLEDNFLEKVEPGRHYKLEIFD